MYIYENDRNKMTTQADSLQNMVSFVEKLQRYDEKTLTIPIKPGKWSTREIIGHLYYWDRYLIEAMIPHIAEGAVLPPFPNHDVYNRAAIASLEGRNASRIIDGFISGRKLLIEQISSLDDKIAFKIRGSEEIFTTDKIIDKFFKHDKLHQGQIETFLSNE
ncbi:DinB family protein [Salipaludibacillus sp. HK11]|uniref:DinB family protein n=1 Tax=Salipaludibacillus sp. HK11 TaxID=3394320 RepID=UPI0039FDA753